LITFDPRDRQKSSTDRINGATTYAYTPTGQLASLTDAEGQTTAYTYDARGSKLTEQYPDHVSGSTIGTTGYGIVSFVYDHAGRVLRKEDQLGDTVTYLHDLAGRMTARDYRAKVNSPAGTIADSDSFTFDRAGRMLTAVSGRYANTVAYSYDPAGRKSTEALTISGQTYTTTTAYDPAGQVSGLTYPNGTVASRTYTDRAQLATLGFNGTTIDTRTYDNGGRMTASSYNNGVSESRIYNTDNTLTSINFTGAPIGNLTYGWDANKNKTSEGISGPMSGYGFNVGGSGYDSEDRLVNWQRSDNNLTQAWNLSLVGDWNSITENSQTQSRTHGPTHELLNVAGQAVQHDVKGNMTLIPANLRPTTSGAPQPLSMPWDFDNRLVSADTNNDSTADVFYKWDALGRRVLRDDGTAATVYVQSDQQTIADYTAGTAATSPTYTYVYASYIDEPVMRSGSGNLVYLHRNQQYSIIALTNGGGSVTERYAYSAYGTPTITDASGTGRTTSAISNRYTYTGREWDETLALYHYRARIYLSELGRFGSRDPIGYDDGFSLYPAYFAPSGVDPSGTKRSLPIILDSLCEKCSKGTAQVECKQRGKKLYESLTKTWNDNHGKGPNTSKDNVGGYLYWDWATVYEEVGKKCGGKVITSERRRIRKIVPDPSKGYPVHFYTRFCAGGDKSKKECCVDVDDGWFIGGRYCHRPDEMVDNHPDWEDDPDQDIPPGRHNPIPPSVVR
jgi:RHS repeat-associated protein